MLWARSGSSLGESRKTRYALGQRDGWKCAYCGKALRPVVRQERTINGVSYAYFGLGPQGHLPEGTIDHVVPLCAGGYRALFNLKLACKECNAEKGDDTLERFLRKKHVYLCHRTCQPSPGVS